MPKRTRDHHAWLREQLANVDFAAEYLNEAHRTSRSIFLKALRNVAEARRMAVVAKQAGVNRETLYRTLSAEGNPSLETYEAVLRALGLEYEFNPKRRGKLLRPAATLRRKANAHRPS
jgi:probable addiction module antidote protein